MSDHTLNNIMCLALIDGQFRQTLLTDASNALAGFELDAEERDVLKTIEAESVTEFARKLHTWMLDRRGNNGHGEVGGPRRMVRRLLLEHSD